MSDIIRYGALAKQPGVINIKTNMNVPTPRGGGLGTAATVSGLLKPVTDAMGNAIVDGAATVFGASAEQRQAAADFRAGRPVVKNLDGVSYNVNTPEGRTAYMQASGKGNKEQTWQDRLNARRSTKPAATPQAPDSGMTNNTSVKPITADGASSPSFYEAVKRGPDSTGNRDTSPPTPSNIPQFGTQMGSRVTMDSMKEYLDGRGLSAHLRNPFSSNQLAGTEEHAKALAGNETPQTADQEVNKGKQELQGGGLRAPTETPKGGLSEISKIFLDKLKDTSPDAVGTMQAAREAQAMRGKFTVDNRYYMNAPQTKDGLVEVSKKQYDRLDGSSDVAQNVLDEQIEFGNLVQEQSQKFAGKSVADVQAAYRAMSDEDKKKYGMAMHAAHFGKFNTPELKSAPEKEFQQGFDQSVAKDAGLPSGLVEYNSERPMIMQEQNQTIDPKTLQGTFEKPEKPMSQNFLATFAKNLFT